jgi:hypothetical protein
MRAWAVVVVGLAVIGFGSSGCKDKELEQKLVASEAQVAACSAKSAGLEAKLAEQERALAAAKAETATLRGTLPPITTSPPKGRAVGKPTDLGF